MHKRKETETERANWQLRTATFFWVMRSCEYLLILQAEKNEDRYFATEEHKVLQGWNSFAAHNNPQCDFADCVSITFEFQKKDERNDSVTQKDTNHAFMSPVKIWYAIIQNQRLYWSER